MFPLSALTLVKMGAILLGAFNLVLMFKGPPPSITEPRQSRSKENPSRFLRQALTRAPTTQYTSRTTPRSNSSTSTPTPTRAHTHTHAR